MANNVPPLSASAELPFVTSLSWPFVSLDGLKYWWSQLGTWKEAASVGSAVVSPLSYGISSALWPDSSSLAGSNPLQKTYNAVTGTVSPNQSRAIQQSIKNSAPGLTEAQKQDAATVAKQYLDSRDGGGSLRDTIDMVGDALDGVELDWAPLLAIVALIVALVVFSAVKR